MTFHVVESDCSRDGFLVVGDDAVMFVQSLCHVVHSKVSASSTSLSFIFVAAMIFHVPIDISGTLGILNVTCAMPDALVGFDSM